MSEQTKTKAVAMMAALCDAILEAIRSTGARGIPSGHLYAMLMDKMSLETYQSIIGALIAADKITSEHHLLKAKSHRIGSFCEFIQS